MSLTPVFIRLSTPDRPERGYADIARIYRGTELLYQCAASTCPNPYSPRTGTRWQDTYAMICCGKYAYDRVEREKFGGPCLMLAGGGEVPTINENVNHRNMNCATEIFVHAGGVGSKNPMWRGSRGCLTISPTAWAEYIAHFDEVESGELIVTDDIEFDMRRSA